MRKIFSTILAAVITRGGGVGLGSFVEMGLESDAWEVGILL